MLYCSSYLETQSRTIKVLKTLTCKKVLWVHTAKWHIQNNMAWPLQYFRTNFAVLIYWLNFLDQKNIKPVSWADWALRRPYIPAPEVEANQSCHPVPHTPQQAAHPFLQMLTSGCPPRMGCVEGLSTGQWRTTQNSAKRDKITRGYYITLLLRKAVIFFIMRSILFQLSSHGKYPRGDIRR